MSDTYFASLFDRGDLWMIVFKRDGHPFEISLGSLAEMTEIYENLAIQWTSVVLAKVMVPDANEVPGGVAREHFEKLKQPQDVEKEFRRWIVATVGADEYHRMPTVARDMARAGFQAGRARRGT